MKKMLLNYLTVTCLILVTFFSSLTNYSAASFKYSDFDFDELLEQNKGYWTSDCDKGDDNCYDKIIKTQRKFYTRLYEILAHYQDREKITIDDNIIIETVFFGLGPDGFRDPVDGEENPYNIDEDSATSYIGSNSSADGAVDYFKNETDSLKTLINNIVSYKQPCYGVSDETPTVVNNVPTCNGEFYPNGNKCVVLIDKLSTSYFDGLFSDGIIFGLFKSDNNNKCKELASNYPSHELGKMSQNKEVDEEGYWEFLINSDYFDKKSHLQHYFSSILQKSGRKKMSDLGTDYSLYEEEIKKCRERIVKDIKSILEEYKPYASNVSMLSGSKTSYWWPIGSTETTESNGIVMAIGEPESININSNYGLRTDPVNGTTNSRHNGIDINGLDSVTNVIAAREGTIISVTDNCSNGDENCGGGYGNFIIIQHIDGNYTLYAHLASVTVKSGDVVSQGQVIGKVGNTGKSTGPHLHFEVRVGGNDSNSAQDPLIFVSSEEPRKVSTSSDLMEWISSMEGTGPMEGNNYVVYADSGGVATFGHGIAVMYNKDLISSYGLNPDSLYVGATVPKSVADEIYASRVQRDMDDIKSQVSAKGITLSDNQLGALVSLRYNTGNINSFFTPYEQYGSTNGLCSNWWENYALHDASGNYLEGLKRRRVSECNAFVNGVYSFE